MIHWVYCKSQEFITCLQIHVNFLNTFYKLCDPSSFEIVPLPCAACSIQAIFWYIHCTTQIPTTMVIAAASHKSRSSHTACWTFSRGNRTNFKSIIGYLCKQKDTVAHVCRLNLINLVYKKKEYGYMTLTIAYFTWFHAIFYSFPRLASHFWYPPWLTSMWAFVRAS